MITLAIAAVLVMIAAPSFQRLMLANRLNTSASAMVGAINQARMDAIKLNAPVQFCGSTAATNGADALGVACSASSAGAIYALPQSAATAGEERATPPGISAPLQIASGGIVAVRFSGRGIGYQPVTGGPDTPYNNRIGVLCTTQLDSNNQRIIGMTTGSVVAVASSSGACP